MVHACAVPVRVRREYGALFRFSLSYVCSLSFCDLECSQAASVYRHAVLCKTDKKTRSTPLDHPAARPCDLSITGNDRARGMFVPRTL